MKDYVAIANLTAKSILDLNLNCEEINKELKQLTSQRDALQKEIDSLRYLHRAIHEAKNYKEGKII